MVELAGQQPCPLQAVGRPSALAKRIGRLEESSPQHWPTKTKTRMDIVMCVMPIQRRDAESKAKSVNLGCAYQDISNTTTQRHSSR
jgi:hypothetical protein